MMRLQTFRDLFEVLLGHDAEQIALVNSDDGQEVSYASLVGLVGVTALALEDMGVRKGDRVMLFELGGVDWVVHFLALQLLGVIAVPIDTRVHKDTVMRFVDLTEPVMVITENESLFVSISGVRKPLAIDDAQLTVGCDYVKQMISTDWDDELISEIILTSGTWSEPKGVTLTQRNLMANLTGIWERYECNGDDSFLSILPLSHIYEQMCGMLVPLLGGARVVYLLELTPGRLKKALGMYEVTTLVAVPKVLELLQKGIMRKVSKRWSSWFVWLVSRLRMAPMWLRRLVFRRVHKELGMDLKTLVVAGAPTSLAVDHFFQGLGYRVLIGYGLSETSPVVTCCFSPETREAGAVGTVLSNVEIRFNADQEILVKAASVFRGYWPEVETEEWFNTGDLGYLNDRGDLVLTGRSKNLLVFGNGDKIFLEDIEQVVEAYDGVDEACVLYDAQTFSGKLWIVFAGDEAVHVDELARYVRDRLPMTVHIERLVNAYPEALHRTHTHKLRRKKNWQVFKRLFDSE